MNRKKAFVILTPGFAASESDSTCLPMQQLFVRTFSEMYPKVEIIILSFQYPYREDKYTWFGKTIISFNGQNKGGIKRLFLRRKIDMELQKIQKEKTVVGLLSFWLGECALLGKIFAEKNKLKHYCWILGQDAKKENQYAKKIKPQEKELIALSEFLQDEFERSHKIRPFKVITPGINAHSKKPEKDIDVIGVGSLIPLKNYEFFIEIVSELKKQFPFIKAVLIGDGPERNKLEGLIEEYGLQENLFLAGEISHERVIEQMAKAKILLHPSSYEGFSGVCIEALSAGAHVVSFCKPMKDDIPHWHVVNSKDEMKQQVSRLLQTSIVYHPVVVKAMEDTVTEMMNLY